MGFWVWGLCILGCVFWVWVLGCVFWVEFVGFGVVLVEWTNLRVHQRREERVRPEERRLLAQYLINQF